MPHQGPVGHRLSRVRQRANAVFAHAREPGGGRPGQRAGPGGAGAVGVGVSGVDLRPRDGPTDQGLAAPALVGDGDTVAGRGLVCGAQHPVCAVQRAVCLTSGSEGPDAGLAGHPSRPGSCLSARQARCGLTLGAMVKKARTIPAVLAVVVLTAIFTGCFHPSANCQQASVRPAAAEFATALHHKVTTDAMMGHLSKLQDIANANNGTRAVGTPRYEATVDYVVNTLRNSGFDVQIPEFSARVFHAE